MGDCIHTLYKNKRYLIECVHCDDSRNVIIFFNERVGDMIDENHEMMHSKYFNTRFCHVCGFDSKKNATAAETDDDVRKIIDFSAVTSCERSIATKLTSDDVSKIVDKIVDSPITKRTCCKCGKGFIGTYDPTGSECDECYFS